MLLEKRIPRINADPQAGLDLVDTRGHFRSTLDRVFDARAIPGRLARVPTRRLH